MVGLLHELGTSSSATGETIVVEFPYERDELSGATSTASVEEGEAPHKASMLSDTVSKVSTEKGELVSSLRDEVVGDEVAGDRKGSQKM